MTDPTPAVPPPTVPDAKECGKCEGCGAAPGPHVRVRTTNGGLLLCRQCLGDINRKNPETAKLREAIHDAGFAVMQTSGKWSIHDVSEKGKEADAVSLRVATENVELSVENKRLRACIGLTLDEKIVSAEPGSVLVDGPGGSRKRVWPSTERERDLEFKLARLRAPVAPEKCPACSGTGTVVAPLRGPCRGGAACPLCKGTGNAPASAAELPSGNGINRMNRATYEGMIADDLKWLEAQPRTLERDHIVQIVKRSPIHEYGTAPVAPAEALSEERLAEIAAALADTPEDERDPADRCIADLLREVARLKEEARAKDAALQPSAPRLCRAQCNALAPGDPSQCDASGEACVCLQEDLLRASLAAKDAELAGLKEAVEREHANWRLVMLQRDAALEAIAAAQQREQALRAETERLTALINCPHNDDWFAGARIEAAHQQERWGATHDGGKEPQDWFWLIGYLAGKCLRAVIDGDSEKAKHHTISTAAACLNWYRKLAANGETK